MIHKDYEAEKVEYEIRKCGRLFILSQLFTLYLYLPYTFFYI